MQEITITITREDAELLLSRTRQIAAANAAIADRYHEGVGFVDECKKKALAFGRISAELDNKLEQPSCEGCQRGMPVVNGMHHEPRPCVEHSVDPPELLPRLLRAQAG